MYGRLIIRKPTGEILLQYTVGQEFTYVGRDKDCDIRIENPGISGKQFLLSAKKDGKVEIQNLSKRPFTTVNQERIGFLVDHNLNDEDVIKAGDREFLWTYNADESVAQSCASGARKKGAFKRTRNSEPVTLHRKVAVVAPHRSTEDDDQEQCLPLKKRRKTSYQAGIMAYTPQEPASLNTPSSRFARRMIYDRMLRDKRNTATRSRRNLLETEATPSRISPWVHQPPNNEETGLRMMTPEASLSSYCHKSAFNTSLTPNTFYARRNPTEPVVFHGVNAATKDKVYQSWQDRESFNSRRSNVNLSSGKVERISTPFPNKKLSSSSLPSKTPRSRATSGFYFPAIREDGPLQSGSSDLHQLAAHRKPILTTSTKPLLPTPRKSLLHSAGEVELCRTISELASSIGSPRAMRADSPSLSQKSLRSRASLQSSQSTFATPRNIISQSRDYESMQYYGWNDRLCESPSKSFANSPHQMQTPRRSGICETPGSAMFSPSSCLTDFPLSHSGMSDSYSSSRYQSTSIYNSSFSPSQCAEDLRSTPRHNGARFSKKDNRSLSAHVLRKSLCHNVTTLSNLSRAKKNRKKSHKPHKSSARGVGTSLPATPERQDSISSVMSAKRPKLAKSDVQNGEGATPNQLVKNTRKSLKSSSADEGKKKKSEKTTPDVTVTTRRNSRKSVQKPSPLTSGKKSQQVNATFNVTSVHPNSHKSLLESAASQSGSGKKKSLKGQNVSQSVEPDASNKTPVRRTSRKNAPEPTPPLSKRGASADKKKSLKGQNVSQSLEPDASNETPVRRTSRKNAPELTPPLSKRGASADKKKSLKALNASLSLEPEPSNETPVRRASRKNAPEPTLPLSKRGTSADKKKSLKGQNVSQSLEPEPSNETPVRRTSRKNAPEPTPPLSKRGASADKKKSSKALNASLSLEPEPSNETPVRRASRKNAPEPTPPLSKRGASADKKKSSKALNASQSLNPPGSNGTPAKRTSRKTESESTPLSSPKAGRVSKNKSWNDERVESNEDANATETQHRLKTLSGRGALEYVDDSQILDESTATKQAHRWSSGVAAQEFSHSPSKSPILTKRESRTSLSSKSTHNEVISPQTAIQPRFNEDLTPKDSSKSSTARRGSKKTSLDKTDLSRNRSLKSVSPLQGSSCIADISAIQRPSSRSCIEFSTPVVGKGKKRSFKFTSTPFPTSAGFPQSNVLTDVDDSENQVSYMPSDSPDYDRETEDEWCNVSTKLVISGESSLASALKTSKSSSPSKRVSFVAIKSGVRSRKSSVGSQSSRLSIRSRSSKSSIGSNSKNASLQGSVKSETDEVIVNQFSPVPGHSPFTSAEKADARKSSKSAKASAGVDSMLNIKQERVSPDQPKSTCRKSSCKSKTSLSVVVKEEVVTPPGTSTEVNLRSSRKTASLTKSIPTTPLSAGKSVQPRSLSKLSRLTSDSLSTSQIENLTAALSPLSGTPAVFKLTQSPLKRKSPGLSEGSKMETSLSTNEGASSSPTVFSLRLSSSRPSSACNSLGSGSSSSLPQIVVTGATPLKSSASNGLATPPRTVSPTVVLRSSRKVGRQKPVLNTDITPKSSVDNSRSPMKKPPSAKALKRMLEIAAPSNSAVKKLKLDPSKPDKKKMAALLVCHKKKSITANIEGANFNRRSIAVISTPISRGSKVGPKLVSSLPKNFKVKTAKKRVSTHENAVDLAAPLGDSEESSSPGDDLLNALDLSRRSENVAKPQKPSRRLRSTRKDLVWSIPPPSNTTPNSSILPANSPKGLLFRSPLVNYEGCAPSPDDGKADRKSSLKRVLVPSPTTSSDEPMSRVFTTSPVVDFTDSTGKKKIFRASPTAGMKCGGIKELIPAEDIDYTGVRNLFDESSPVDSAQSTPKKRGQPKLQNKTVTPQTDDLSVLESGMSRPKRTLTTKVEKGEGDKSKGKKVLATKPKVKVGNSPKEVEGQRKTRRAAANPSPKYTTQTKLRKAKKESISPKATKPSPQKPSKKIVSDTKPVRVSFPGTSAAVKNKSVGKKAKAVVARKVKGKRGDVSQSDVATGTKSPSLEKSPVKTRRRVTATAEEKKVKENKKESSKTKSRVAKATSGATSKSVTSKSARASPKKLEQSDKSPVASPRKTRRAPSRTATSKKKPSLKAATPKSKKSSPVKTKSSAAKPKKTVERKKKSIPASKVEPVASSRKKILPETSKSPANKKAPSKSSSVKKSPSKSSTRKKPQPPPGKKISGKSPVKSTRSTRSAKPTKR